MRRKFAILNMKKSIFDAQKITPMKNKKRVILLLLIVLFGAIQLIRPERNQQTNPSRYDVFHKTDTDPLVIAQVQSACYDCHSNRTAYPWYASIAPVSWMISQHVKDGKKHLNFSQWILYPQDRQAHKLDEIIEVLQEDEMPPKPYQWLHKESVMNSESRQLVLSWASKLKSDLSNSNQ